MTPNHPVKADLRKRASPACSTAHGRREASRVTTAASRELARLLPAELSADWDAIRKLVDEWFATYGNSDPILTAVAVEVAEAYVAKQLPFLVANAVVGHLMNRRGWQAPTDFWEVFIAFEDLEIEEEPGPRGSEHVAAALEKVRAGSAGTHKRRYRGAGTPGSSDARPLVVPDGPKRASPASVRG